VWETLSGWHKNTQPNVPWTEHQLMVEEEASEKRHEGQHFVQRSKLSEISAADCVHWLNLLSTVPQMLTAIFRYNNPSTIQVLITA